MILTPETVQVAATVSVLAILAAGLGFGFSALKRRKKKVIDVASQRVDG